MANEKYRAIVLRAAKYGEHDKMLTLFTLEKGRTSAVAKGASSPKSRFIGASQLYCASEFVLSKSLKMPYVVSADIINGFYGIDKDILKATAASYVAELMNIVFDDEDEAAQPFRLLYYTLQALSENPPQYALLTATAFALKLMGLNGTYPVLDRCVSCGKKSDGYLFDSASGGLLCNNCAPVREMSMLSGAEADYLYTLMYIGLDKLTEVNLPQPDVQKYLFKLVNGYVVYVTEKNIKSFSLLYQL